MFQKPRRGSHRGFLRATQSELARQWAQGVGTGVGASGVMSNKRDKSPVPDWFNQFFYVLQTTVHSM